jgi:hypothetical protein
MGGYGLVQSWVKAGLTVDIGQEPRLIKVKIVFPAIKGTTYELPVGTF